jgi:hypothetical protein
VELEAASLDVRTDVDDELLEVLVVDVDVDLLHILTKHVCVDLADIWQVDPVEQVSQLSHLHLRHRGVEVLHDETVSAVRTCKHLEDFNEQIVVDLATGVDEVSSDIGNQARVRLLI